MATDAKNPEHWFDFASDDLIRAHRRFAEGDGVDCLFHLQQSAEKALKGRLIACGWKLQRTHDLSALIVALKTLGMDCSWFESSASVLATEYIADRYPDSMMRLPNRTSCELLSWKRRSFLKA